MWVREGRDDQQNSRLMIQENGSLFLPQVDKNDSGIYACSPDNVVNDDIKARIKVLVRSKNIHLFLSVSFIFFYYINNH